jgi:hypothetical protein
MGNCFRRPKVTPLNAKIRRRTYSITTKETNEVDNRNNREVYNPYSVKHYLEEQNKMFRLYEALDAQLKLIITYTNENKHHLIPDVIRLITILIEKIISGKYADEYVKKCTDRIKKIDNKTLNRILEQYEI